MAISQPPIQEKTTDQNGRFPQIWIRWFNLLRDKLNFILGIIDDDGNITTSGFITGRKTGAAGYLASPVNVTVTTAGTYYPIGVFTVPVAEDFSQGVIYTNGLKYDATKTQYFNVEWHATVDASKNSTTIHVAVQKNGVTQSMSIMGCLCKLSGEIYNLSGKCVLELEQDDEVQFVITSDTNGDVITFDYFTASIGEFFD